MRESFQSYCERMELRALLEQWDTGRNLSLTPEQISYGSKRKVWWRCKNGHSWQAAVHTRTGCLVCAGNVAQAGENDLATLFPELSRQWHPTKNGNLTPELIPLGTIRKVWWHCEKGHEWQFSVSSWTCGGSGYPYCAGRKVLPGFNNLATLEPEVARQWHPALNGTLMPKMVTAGTHRKVWWECDQGHVWQAAIYSCTGPKKCGCPICAERVITKRLKQYRSMQFTHSLSMPPANQGDV